MAPPRSRGFVMHHLAAFDDEALRVFLRPGDAGVDAELLGLAAQGEDLGLAQRFLTALPPGSRRAFLLGHTREAPPGEIRAAQRRVVDCLFWVLLYWHEPGAYEELVAGERIHPGVLDLIDLDGRTVCDVGAGTGRFTIAAAVRAAGVIAVDAVPALIRRLERRIRDLGMDNVEVRRGSFTALPLDDASVDVAVACSSLTSREPFGGQPALDEMERVVRPGGQLAVIWPDRPEWFCERGFTHLTAEGNDSLHFADAAAAERLCRDFYSEEAAEWVVATGRADVPFAVLGVPPPNNVCIRRLPDQQG